MNEIKVRISQGIIDEVNLRDMATDEGRSEVSRSMYAKIAAKRKPATIKVTQAEFAELWDEADYWMPERGSESYLKSWKALYRQLAKLKNAEIA